MGISVGEPLSVAVNAVAGADRLECRSKAFISLLAVSIEYPNSLSIE